MEISDVGSYFGPKKELPNNDMQMQVEAMQRIHATGAKVRETK